MTRRRVLGWIVATLSGALGAAVAVPTAIFWGASARSRPHGEDEPVDLIGIDQLPEGRPVRVTVTAARRRDAWTAFTDVALGACWLLRRGEQVAALSTICPHAGCAVDFDEGRGLFSCPCHASTFALDGSRLSGPSPRALDRLVAVVVKGRVRVAWQRFRTARANKEAI